MLFVGGKRVEASTITRAGWVVAVVAAIALYVVARMLRP
jgi:fumarate reductase subunit C